MVGAHQAPGPDARDPFPLRSVLAPPRWSAGAAFGAAAVALVVVADALTGSGAALVAGLAALLVGTAAFARRGDAAAVGALAVVAAALGGLWTDWNAAEQALAVG